MHRSFLPTILLTIIATLTITTPAQAAANCPIHTSIVEQATNQTITGNQIQGFWDVKCSAAYRVKLVLQYSDANGWHGAVCQWQGFGPPCPVTRPSSNWFAANDEHQGNETWSLATPGHICNNHQFRIELVFTFQNGSGGITYIPAGTGIGC